MGDDNSDYGTVYFITEDGKELNKTTRFENDPPKWETVKTAVDGETFTDFRIEHLNAVYHLDTTKGKYTGRPNADGGIDWKFEVEDE